MTRPIRPRLSQHFLHDAQAADRIAGALRAPPGARVAEIGPGRGALTQPLLARGWRVTAVELDSGLAAGLERRWAGNPALTIIAGDALEYRPPPDPAGEPWYVIGNLPYAITSPLLFRWLAFATTLPVAEYVFLMQREVALRLVAAAGSAAYGALTVNAGLAADSELLFDLGPGSFRPPPRVRSSVVRLVPHDRWGLDDARRQRLRTLVQGLFGQRRKQLQKSLRTLPSWRLDAVATDRVAAVTGLDLARRPETLRIEEWLALDGALADAGTPAASGNRESLRLGGAGGAPSPLDVHPRQQEPAHDEEADD
ncbi:MAG: 16S rRNA (adenine(1518)-N(6)/adenine(1519)-N(6))-dimethyltransferase RsmA [Gemmatimonadota bacterium]